jgi:hypothetical protein
MKSYPLMQPIFEDVMPIARHGLYGINCYQHAIGIRPITLHYNKLTRSISYLTLCPGNTAQHISQRASLPASHEMKELVIQGSKEDGLVELETRNPEDSINIPVNSRLIALYFSLALNDFDFHVFNQEKRSWENKTPFAPVTEIEKLPRILGGGYTLCRLFIAEAQNIRGHGVPQGQSYKYQDGTSLNLPQLIKPWERGPALKCAENGYFLERTNKIYAAPDLSFIDCKLS